MDHAASRDAGSFAYAEVMQIDVRQTIPFWSATPGIEPRGGARGGTPPIPASSGFVEFLEAAGFVVRRSADIEGVLAAEAGVAVLATLPAMIRALEPRVERVELAQVVDPDSEDGRPCLSIEVLVAAPWEAGARLLDELWGGYWASARRALNSDTLLHVTRIDEL